MQSWRQGVAASTVLKDKRAPSVQMKGRWGEWFISAMINLSLYVGTDLGIWLNMQGRRTTSNNTRSCFGTASKLSLFVLRKWFEFWITDVLILGLVFLCWVFYFSWIKDDILWINLSVEVWKGQEEFYLVTSLVFSSSALSLIQEVKKAIKTTNMLLVPQQVIVAGKLIGMLFRAEIYHCVFISIGHGDT